MYSRGAGKTKTGQGRGTTLQGHRDLPDTTRWHAAALQLRNTHEYNVLLNWNINRIARFTSQRNNTGICYIIAQI